jgi:hypothetical protein
MNDIVFKPFTIVFDKDIREIKESPFQIETVFGTPVAIARGDLTEKIFELEAEIEKFQAENKALREALEPFSSLCDYIDDRRKMNDFDTTPVCYVHLKTARAALHRAAEEHERPAIEKGFV